MMKTNYQCLDNQEYTQEGYSLVPIRWQDRYKIMQWRNEQMFHLRQDKELTVEDQDAYFENIVAKLFDLDKPKQILFSFLKDKECIGYGGLVHIDWNKKTAEISFLINSELERTQFSKLWLIFLSMIEKIAFHEIKLNEVFTYSYEVRPKLYPILDQAGFIEKERISAAIQLNNKSIDGLIHIKRKKELSYRPVEYSDVQLLFEWATDSSTRNNSINSKEITWDEHVKWFNEKMNDHKSSMFLFLKEKPVGVLRLDEVNNQFQISFSVDRKQRGKGIGNQMISFILKKFSGNNFSAQVLENNRGSHRIFLKNKFSVDSVSRKGNKTITHYIKEAFDGNY